MKNRVNRCILAVLSLALCGCSAIYPASLATLPATEETSAEGNLPSVQEMEVSEAKPDNTSLAGSGQTGSVETQTTVSPFETSELEMEHSDSTEEPLQLFLTASDENYIYEMAYRTGDYSALDEQQVQVMSIVGQIVSQCQGYSDYDKALFVHDYLTATTSYGFCDEQYSAYGALVEHVAVCQGYAYAFKLCMDLLEIPCITVGGTADNGEEVLSHAWNMIQLGNSWYHVDVTWDDATTSVDYGSWCHLYFCVDDAFMAQNHTWTDLVQGIHGLDEFPEASDMSMFYYGSVTALQSSQEELESRFAYDFQNGMRRGEYCCYGFEPDTSFIGSYAAGSLIYQTLGAYVLLYVDLQ